MSIFENHFVTEQLEAIGQPETPFAEGAFETYLDEEPQLAGIVPWTEDESPFAESFTETASATEDETLFAEAFAELRDEQFDEALSELVEETAGAVGQQFDVERSSALGGEMERLGAAHLSPIQAEAENYLDRLNESFASTDMASLSEQQFSEMFDRIQPQIAELSPAGQEFIGGVIRKARKAASFVVAAAKKAASVTVGPMLKSILMRLRKLIRPLLRRVLSFAINRLPAPLRPQARALAKRLTGELEDEGDTESLTTSAVPIDPEALAESFDAAVAEAVASGHSESAEFEQFDEAEEEGPVETREMEALAEARAILIDRIKSAKDEEDLLPAIEQFVPVLLGALRVGIRIVGRQRVIKFLAGYLARFIGKWVKPAIARPLSIAIVDTGLRLVAMESEEFEGRDEAVPVLLATTIEDTVRRLAESEEFTFEDEDLLQLATGDAFEQAVAANFPTQYVKPELQLAPGIQGSFVARNPRSPHTYRAYTKRSEVQVTAQLAGAVNTFGGTTLAGSLRASGIQLPFKVRVHIFEATAGSTLRKIAALERARGGGSRISSRQIHPLTPKAAALLLREPRLGVRVAPTFLRSRQRIAAGQRFYYLEPISQRAGLPSPQAPTNGRPSQGWIIVDLIRSEVRVALFVSEADAQSISADIRQQRSPAAILRALATIYDGVSRSFENPSGRVRIIKEFEEGEEFLGSALSRLTRVATNALRRALASWVLPALAQWMRTRSAEFARKASEPADGVTIRIQFRGVPGLSTVREVLAGRNLISNARAIASGSAFSGTPTVDVSLTAGLSNQ